MIGAGLIGVAVSGGTGEPLGRVAAVYTDTDTGRPVWAGVDGERGTAIVPLDASTFDGVTLHLPYVADQLRSAPQHPTGTTLSFGEAAELNRHYGLDPTGDQSGDPEQHGIGPGQDAVVTRSEEQLRLDRTYVQFGRARLVTTVVTEDVTFTIPLRRQQIHLEYDELAPQEQRPAAGPPAARTYEIVRHEERAHFTTRIVPVERVRLVTSVVRTEQVLTEELRHEQVDLHTDPPPHGGDRHDTGPEIRPAGTGDPR